MQQHNFQKTFSGVSNYEIVNIARNNRGSEFSSYEIELQSRVTQNDVALRATNSKFFIESLAWIY